MAVAVPAVAALKAGDPAPEFQAQASFAGKATRYSLKDALKKGPVVVYFFPAVHTPGCNMEAHLFSEAIDDFKVAHATVIGVSAGKIEEMAAFSAETEHCGGKFAVAADAGAKIARKYDSLLPQKPGWSNRTSYVIGQDGRIVHAYSELKPTEHVKETLTAVQALAKAK